MATKLAGKQAAGFKALVDGRSLEQGLSRLRRIYALVEGSGQTVDDLTGDEAKELDRAICRAIVAEVDVAKADLEPMLRFAAWVGRADYHLPLEVFTVNYDVLIETALERLRVPYFDGFIGAFRAPFRTDLVEAAPADVESWLPSFMARLWKLHGSVSWEWEEEAEVVRLGRAVEDTQAAAIYPSDTKYDESRRVPFVVLHDRLRRALHHPETLMIVTGLFLERRTSQRGHLRRRSAPTAVGDSRLRPLGDSRRPGRARADGAEPSGGNGRGGDSWWHSRPVEGEGRAPRRCLGCRSARPA